MEGEEQWMNEYPNVSETIILNNLCSNATEDMREDGIWRGASQGHVETAANVHVRSVFKASETLCKSGDFLGKGTPPPSKPRKQASGTGGELSHSCVRETFLSLLGSPATRNRFRIDESLLPNYLCLFSAVWICFILEHNGITRHSKSKDRKSVKPEFKLNNEYFSPNL
ncbi:hypothetical protein E5288_WYG008095 [Bos mutus]|uniref:Uncharacterized protein n=1 Tax=Bos mutus TaxID=72004 RepID=A0A6B0RV41_9CETA|nr:hypothetical protein [Bos mutus]